MTKLELPDGMGPAEALRGLADDLLAPDAKLRAFVDFGKEGRWDSGPLEGATHGGFLRLVADLIDRKTTRNPADDVTMSAYDLIPEEDRKAIAWVRENGGFEEAKDYYECGRRIEPWNEQKADLYELMNECGGVDEIKKRLMPAGMEWPRFDDREPVRPGDEFADGLGGTRVCTSVEFPACEEGVRDVLIHWDGDDPDNAMLVCMASGERVKRIHEMQQTLNEALPAAKWVKEHGGIAECDRKVEASMDVGDKYTLLRMELGKLLGYDLMGQLDASDEELVEKLKKNTRITGDYLDALNAICKCLGLTDGTALPELPEVILHEIDKRLMPVGVEWPKYTDGELVRIGGCWGRDGYDTSITYIERIIFAEDGVYLDNEYNEAFYRHEERVKRPAPKVLDADGVEIRVGDTVYGVETGALVTVEGIESGNPWFTATTGTLYHCSKFTHRAPVLAADGRPLREGETVWHKQTGRAATVKGFDRMLGEPCAVIDFAGIEQRVSGTLLTHEQTDSWERLEEDAGKNPFDYCKDVGHRLDTCENSEAYKARDLVRRAKKLAGVSEW